ncbi:MAG: gamma-glutamylcyclotransferase [Syntrophobacteraceae bacterium]|nr:gamma-glutamylcyclotransferase [Syntrophobacteraceae bacterium]
MSKRAPTFADEPIFVTESRSVELYHFAYGPNMNALQIGRLCSKPKVVTIARLPDYRVGFFGYSPVWDGAQESVVREPGHDVWGVVYKLSPSDKESLDASQDVRMDGNGNYFHYPARVDGVDGRTYTVLFYKKDILGKPEKPSRPYLDIIVSGAEEKQLPAEYVQELRAIESKSPSYPVPRLRKFTAGILAAGDDCSSCSD